MRLAAVSAVALLLALAVAGCTSDGGTGEHVLVIGDSLTVGAQMAGLGEDQPDDWEVDAVEGRSTRTGIDVARDRHASDQEMVVVALGTNDYTDSTEEYAAKIDEMMDVIGPTPRVIWVNVDVGSEHVAQAAEGVNPAIAAAVDRYSNLEVGDWAAYVNGQPDPDSLRAGDGTHYNPEGYGVRARWTESLVAR